MIPLILLPFFVYAPGKVLIHNSHMYSFLSISILFIWSSYTKNNLIRAFMVYVFCHIAVAPVLYTSNFLPSYIDLFFIVSGSAMFLAIVRGEIKYGTWCHVLAGLCVLHSVIAALQFIGYNPVLWLYPKASPGSCPISSFFGNPNYLTHNLAIMLPFMFKKKWAYLIPLPVFIILQSKSLGSFIAMAAATSVYLWIRYKPRQLKTMSVLVLVCAAVYFFNRFLNGGQDIFHDSRLETWHATIQHIASGGWHTIVLGHGIGNAYWDKINAYPHNDFLVIATRYGVIGVLFVFMYIVDIVKTYRRYPIELLPALSAAMMAMMVSNVIQLIPSMMLVIVVLALMDRERNGVKIDNSIFRLNKLNARQAETNN